MEAVKQKSTHQNGHSDGCNKTIGIVYATILPHFAASVKERVIPMVFRDLKASEIQCRIVSIEEDRVKLLLCRDPRTDSSILTEGVGNLQWQRTEGRCGNDWVCSVGVNLYYNEPRRNPVFTWKSGVGQPRFPGDLKGESSEAFQRACVEFGIGAELYTAPPILITGVKTRLVEGKFVTDERFRVSHISIEKKRITELTIVRFWKDEQGAWQCATAFDWKRTNADGEDS